MVDNTKNMQEDFQTTHSSGEISLLGGKIKLNPRQIGLFKVILPLTVVILCAIVMWVMLGSALQSGNNIDGRFVSSAGEEDYIEMNSNGEYVKVTGETKEEGIWSIDGNALTFESGSNTVSGQFVERKYIVLSDENFLSGQVAVEGEEEAEVTASDGTVYGFDPNGKFYSKVDGAYMEIGSYIADGYFIVVTTAEGSVTYLNCGDGITSVFYRAV